MRKAISVSALILAFVCSAHADEMQNGFTSTPPPQSATASATAVPAPTTEGEIQNDAAESLTQIALNVLAVLPSLP
jgi:hypothetical protein